MFKSAYFATSAEFSQHFIKRWLIIGQNSGRLLCMSSHVDPIPAGHAANKFLFQQLTVHGETNFLLGLQQLHISWPVHRGGLPVFVGPRFSQVFEATIADHIPLLFQIKHCWHHNSNPSNITSATTDDKCSYSCEFKHCSCHKCH
jgi:hypothetical protein